MIKELCFDMDGTIADFYGVEGWLDYLDNEDTTPYEVAKPLLNFSLLARYLNRLQKIGYNISIISWTSKSGTNEFNDRIAEVKKEYLRKHLASVVFDNIHIIPYGTPKQNYGNGILFDDEKGNRENWCGEYAFDEQNILDILKELITEG